MAFPSDLANQPMVSSAEPLDGPISNPKQLQAATDAIITALDDAKTACILPGIMATRAGAREALHSFVYASGLPFATMFADKSVWNLFTSPKRWETACQERDWLESLSKRGDEGYSVRAGETQS